MLSTSSSPFLVIGNPEELSSGTSILNFSLNLIFPGLMMFEGRFALAPELKTGFDKIDVFDGY